MRKSPIEIGGIFEIPLGDGRKAFGQYVYLDKRYGPIIRIFDLILDVKGKINVKDITNNRMLFPPIFIVGLYPVFREGHWKIVGNAPVDNFTYPGFLSTAIDYRNKKHGFWYLIDEKSSTKLGSELPDQYKKLEYLALYPPDKIVKRVKIGKKPYKHLIESGVVGKDRDY